MKQQGICTPAPITCTKGKHPMAINAMDPPSESAPCRKARQFGIKMRDPIKDTRESVAQSPNPQIVVSIQASFKQIRAKIQIVIKNENLKQKHEIIGLN